MDFSGFLGPEIDDPDFAYLAFLSHTQRQMQEKTSTVADNSAHLGLKVHRGKSKALKNNASVSTTPITQAGDALENVTSFAYLGSIVGLANKGGEGGGGGEGYWHRCKSEIWQSKSSLPSNQKTSGLT